MNAELSFREAITKLGGDAPNRDRLFETAARAAGISFSQAKKLFYGATTDPKASVRDKVARALQKLNDKATSNARAQTERTEDVAQLLARAVEADENLRREVLALVLRRLAGAGPEDRAVVEGDDQ